jgi:hypothetical protein
LAAAAAAALFFSPGARPAGAVFHFMVIDEVMAGVPGDASVQYIELRMLSAGQNITNGQTVEVRNSAGAVIDSWSFPLGPSGNVPNGAMNARILIATTAAETFWGLQADLEMDSAAIPPSGSVCFVTVDCVAFGSATSAPSDMPASVNKPGNGTRSLYRTSNTNLSANDFALLCPDPQNNANAMGIWSGGNPDGDVPSDCDDNCPSVNNPGQANRDAEALPNGPNVSGDDTTIVNSDVDGDDCDSDKDNDGVADTDETTHPVAGCLSASTALDPQDIDTDGDHLTDGWECANGSDPADDQSKFVGSGSTDADGDKIADLWEQRGYGVAVSNINADGDGCADLVEIASVDGNKTITDTDRIVVARRALGIILPDVDQDYVLDVDKNGSVVDPDRIFVARAALLPTWQPKSCP